MKLELAEAPGNFRYRKTIPGYRRRSNYVPPHYRHFNDSSLFSFRLNDCSLSGRVINNLFLTIPDPSGQQAPRKIRIDMFDELPAEEYQKLILYAEPYNSPEVIDAAICYRNQLADGETVIPSFSIPLPTARQAVEAAYQSPTFNAAIQPASWWDKKILGVPVKYAVPIGLLLLLK